MRAMLLPRACFADVTAVIPPGGTPRYRRSMTCWRLRTSHYHLPRLIAVVLMILWTAAACGRSGPPKPDVVAELQKLKIPTIPKTFTAEQKANVEKAWDGPAKWFVHKGCIACHAISVHDIKGLTAIGPDLSIAETDVQKRFGRTLEDFLDKPQGTMQMVLGDLIKLSPEDKASAIKALRAFHQEHERRKSAAGSH